MLDSESMGTKERHQTPSMTGRGNGFLTSSIPPVLQRLVSRSLASAQHPCLVVAVDDIQAAMGQVTDAGGKVLGEPLEIPGVGQYVSFFDTEGNRVSMLQRIPRN